MNNPRLPKSPLRIAAAIACCILSLAFPTTAIADYPIDYKAEGIFNTGNGDFAPYYIASNRHGIITQRDNAILRMALSKNMDTNRRFTYGFGVDLIGGYGSEADYLRYYSSKESAGMSINTQHPTRFWIQQLYGEIKYRGVFLTVGLKEHSSALLNHTLSSGDLIESGNARPIPEVRAGFIDFQNIPFTQGWVQIQGEISYGKMTDNGWLKDHYNYYSKHINLGALYSYKRCYFRTKPSEPFSATVGMQVGAFFGGTSTRYERGDISQTTTFSKGIKQFFKMLLPTDGGLEYYSGSSLGSWDLMFRYRFRNRTTLKAYFQKPFEDGSGIGFLNGFDGLWGLEYTMERQSYISGIVIEYLDFTNQSGPMHWDPDDVPGTTINNRAEGADNYYNNAEYRSYSNYGMAIGTPFLPSPIYNHTGSLEFTDNRVRGFHIGIEGELTDHLNYRLLGGYRKGWGTARIPFVTTQETTSLMAEARYSLPNINGLSIHAQLALDHGNMFGNNIGGCLTVTYRGLLNLK